jgi:hypothetical protein
VLLRERESESEPQNALSAFVCALCVKIVYELGGRGYKGFLAALLFICLLLWGFNSCTERQRERARSLLPYSSVIILCSSRFFQVERSESASFLSVARK